MIFITGETTGKKMVNILMKHGWGRMFIRKRPTPYYGERWGFDNGAYVCWQNNTQFDEDKYMKRLDVAYRVDEPYMAVVPDIVGGGSDSLEYSLRWIKKLPPWPWYLAVQDGMEYVEVENVIDLFDGLFLGGTNTFKSTAYSWCKLAHSYGKKFHYGRAGTPNKVLHALRVGADSADSAFPLWTYDRMDELIKFIDGPKQMSLWSEEVLSEKF